MFDIYTKVNYEYTIYAFFRCLTQGNRITLYVTHYTLIECSIENSYHVVLFILSYSLIAYINISLQLKEEKENVTWQSISNNIPRGGLSFALKACSNRLNTPDNLTRWNIRKTDKCDLCKNRSSLEHILNWCLIALEEGQFTWQPNSARYHFATSIKKTVPEGLEILC